MINIADNDQQLIEKFCQGDHRAFETLYLKHQRGVYLKALRIVRDKEMARDIVQECFLRVWLERQGFRSGERFSPWLYKIVSNLCWDYLRKKSVLKLVSLNEPVGNPGDGIRRQIPDNSALPDEVFNNSELRQNLWKAIHSLPQKYEEVFVLKRVEGLSRKDIAMIINRPETTVKSRLYYATKLLRQKLKVYKKDRERTR